MNDSMNAQYDDMIVDSSALDPVDAQGNPIPVTIPIELAPHVKVVYTTRLGGSSCGDWASCNLGGKAGDDPNVVTANRIALSKAVGAPLSLVAQVHSGRAIDADEDADFNAPYGCDRSGADAVDDRLSADRRLEADGQVTARAGLAVGVFAADCLPVLVTDPQAGVIGVAHCGRRGLERGIVSSTIDAMERKGASVERIVATLGPCICGDCYEVGDQVAAAFDARFPGTRTTTRFGGAGIDIAEAALQELSRSGVDREHVVDSTPRVAAATQYLEYDDELEAVCRTDGDGGADDHAGEPVVLPASSSVSATQGDLVDTSDEVVRDGTFEAVVSATAGIPVAAMSPEVAAQARRVAVCADLGARINAMQHPLCTLENPLWYSHRRSAFADKPHEGRMLALIVREH
ncbi:YfiH family protein [Bifidobacterium bohemicum]|nr:polyphenol oxidase family protein [Bifidobacterium bohemicum]SCB94645.1 YfiH family protein [Bifidobacterium bohemicum]